MRGENAKSRASMIEITKPNQNINDEASTEISIRVSKSIITAHEDLS